MSRALWGALLVVAVGLSGCGEKADTGSTTAAARVQACELLTGEDAAAVLGEEVNQMSSMLSEAQGGDPSHCGYNAGSDTTRLVSLEVRQADSAERARGRFESARSVLAGAEELQGLGDAAFWAGRGVDQVHVLRGDLHLIITSRPGPEHDAKAAARTLAEKALGRLGS